MAANPSFAVTPRIGSVALAAADTSYTAPTNTATVITGAATGTRVAEVVVQMNETTVATMVRLFLFDGTTHFLFDEIPIAAATGSQTVRQARVSTIYNNLILPSSSWSLRATVHSTHTGIVTALGADL
jgi:pyoverdine/dityrosine biosynthesis protein Dit1